MSDIIPPHDDFDGGLFDWLFDIAAVAIFFAAVMVVDGWPLIVGFVAGVLLGSTAP